MGNPSGTKIATLMGSGRLVPKTVTVAAIAVTQLSFADLE